MRRLKYKYLDYIVGGNNTSANIHVLINCLWTNWPWKNISKTRLPYSLTDLNICVKCWENKCVSLVVYGKVHDESVIWRAGSKRIRNQGGGPSIIKSWIRDQKSEIKSGIRENFQNIRILGGKKYNVIVTMYMILSSARSWWIYCKLLWNHPPVIFKHFSVYRIWYQVYNFDILGNWSHWFSYVMAHLQPNITQLMFYLLVNH